MKIYSAKTFEFFKKEPFLVIFAVVFLSSLFVHLSVRSDHFQECDSSGVYKSVYYGFPDEALLNTLNLSQGKSFISPSQVRWFLNLAPVSGVVNNFEHKGLKGEEIKNKIVEKLTGVNPVIGFRLAFLSFLSSVHWPRFVTGAFGLANGSTYSFGSGLVYSLVGGANPSWENFISRASLVTILLFHLSVLLLFLLSLKLGIRRRSAVIVSTLMLFSVSLYSYSYHLGSTIWNIFTGFLWFFFLISWHGKENFLKKISILSGILLFFNYLIGIFWGAFVLAHLLDKIKRDKPVSAKKTWLAFYNFLKKQKFFLVSLVLIFILFYPPGQSNRGTTSIQTFPSDLYYVILNFFSFYVHSPSVDVIQFLIGIFLISTLAFGFLKAKSDAGNSGNHAGPFFSEVASSVFIVFFVLVLFGVFGFLPSRHILFLTPPLFIGISFGLNRFFEKIKVSSLIGFCILAVVVVSGLLSLKTRIADANDITRNLSFDNRGVEKVVVQDCSYDLIYRKWNSKIPVEFADPGKFKIGSTYLYLSQTTPFKKAPEFWKDFLGFDVGVKVSEDFNFDNPVYFIAYNPRELVHDRPNGLYETKFKVTNLTLASTTSQ